MTSAIEERLQNIKMLVCDVDGVLTDGRIWFDGEGRPFRSLHVRDGTGLTLWRLAGGKTALVSGLGSKAVESVAKQWHCDEVHMFTKDKGRVIREMATRHGLTLAEMAFVGDDIIDIRAMEMCGLGVVVADGASEAKRVADIVTEACGGAGAVREVVYRILRAQGRLEAVIESYCDRKDGPQ